MTVGVDAIAICLPPMVVTSDEIVLAHNFDKDFVFEKLGIASRHVLSDGETVSWLARSAVDELLATTGRPAEDVGLLIVVTQTPDYGLPHVSAIVQAEAGIPQSALVMDVGLGCSGYVYGLATARALMAAEGIAVGVLVTVDAYSRIVDPTERNTAPLFGDAATATLLVHDARYSVGRSTFGTDGSRHESLIVRGSGSTAGPRGQLVMDGREIFDFALREVPKDIWRCLELNGLAIEDIDRVVLHQANAFMVKSIARRLKLPDERVVLEIGDVGNTTSSSIPIALARRILNRPDLPRHVLLSGFGVGLSWGSTILTASGGADHDG